MRRAIMATVAAMVLVPGLSRADGCADAAQAIADATGATIGQRSVGSDVFVRLAHPDAQDFALHCKGIDPRRGPDVFVSYASVTPPPSYFTLATKAASALLGQKPAAIRAATQRCHQASKRDPDESGTVETKALRVECTVNKAARGTTLLISSSLMRPY